MKLLKTSDELIKHLDDKGCKFNIVDKTEAKEFLSESNYYLKLAAYRANYDKSQSGKNAGKYKNLEFAYLKELSIIDMHLRKLIFNMCIDIEHSIKVRLLKNAEDNEAEDGYNSVRLFVSQDIAKLKSIINHQSEYCKGLIDKYYPYFPIWVYVELISFGELAHFCNFYNGLYKTNFLGIDNRLLNSVRDLRNASAHNSCLINKLNSGNNTPLSEIDRYIDCIQGIGSSSKNKKLRNKFIYDFITLIYVYFKVIQSSKMREKQKEILKNVICERMQQNIHYFDSNLLVKSSFDFLKKVVDNL